MGLVTDLLKNFEIPHPPIDDFPKSIDILELIFDNTIQKEQIMIWEGKCINVKNNEIIFERSFLNRINQNNKH